MTWATVPSRFKCGACGTEAGPFMWVSELESFQTLHAALCPGYPPTRGDVHEPPGDNPTVQGNLDTPNASRAQVAPGGSLTSPAAGEPT